MGNHQWLAVALTGALMIAVARNSESHVASQIPGKETKAGLSLGRDVYISEGCIHCHSQYVRPDSPDVQWWGPVAPADVILAGQPPLIGNRRQGPDLLNIGNRRSREWNRIHLIAPRTLVPQSRMPSYSYLFHKDDPRGEALIEYLSTLGATTMEERYASRSHWQPEEKASSISEVAAGKLYQSKCAMCHGRSGKGDGALANSFGDRFPRDLTKAQWLFIPKREKDEERRIELMRVIKFGIPATSMPGHETMSDRELLGLARYVESLQVSTYPL
jgi:cytochrome c1